MKLSTLFTKRKIIYFYLLRRLLGKRLVVIVGSTYKVGSTWLFQMLKEYGAFWINRTPDNLKQPGGSFILDSPDSKLYLNNLPGYSIFKTHSPPTILNDNKIRFISIYRDPRDAIVSESFYLSNLKVEYGGWGQDFTDLPVKERIRRVINETPDYLELFNQWFDTNDVCKTSYEKLKGNTEEELEKILFFLNLRVNKKKLRKVIKNNSFENKSGRNTGEEDEKSFLRKGLSGDWKNYFDDELVEEFKKAHDGAWNDLVIRMGYENDPYWNLN